MLTFKCGPSGNGGGTPFSDDAMVPGERVAEVRVWHGALVDAIQVIHHNAAGAAHEFEKHGGGGGKLSVFTLDDDEYITGISGGSGNRVDSVQLQTNKQSSPQYGGGGGLVKYIYEIPEAYEIVGFHGRAGAVLDALGVIYRKR